jgi:hypothetical protein
MALPYPAPTIEQDWPFHHRFPLTDKALKMSRLHLPGRRSLPWGWVKPIVTNFRLGG